MTRLGCLLLAIAAAILAGCANTSVMPDPRAGAIAELLEVAAGVKQQLEADAGRVGGVRLLPGRFMVIEQAMGVPKGRAAAQAWLSGFIEEMKSSGFVAAALQRHGIQGAAVAPPRAGS